MAIQSNGAACFPVGSRNYSPRFVSKLTTQLSMTGAIMVLKMKMYSFGPGPQFVTFTPTNHSGIPLGDDEDECSVESIDECFVRCMFKESESSLPTFLSIGTKRYLALHASALSVLLNRLRMPATMRCIKLIVMSRDRRRKLSQDYLLLMAREEFDVLDKRMAQYDSVVRDNGDDVVISVNRWCIRKEAIPALDLIPVLPNDWLVHESFRELAMEEQWSNVVFGDVVVN